MMIHRNHRNSTKSFVQEKQRFVDINRPVLSNFSTHYNNFFNPTFKLTHYKRFSSTADNYNTNIVNITNSVFKRRSLHKRQNTQQNNESQMVNYILCGVKQKYKEKIYKQKIRVSKDKQLKTSELSDKMSFNKQKTKLYDCFNQSLKVIKKQILSQNLNINFANKKLINERKARKLRSAQKISQRKKQITNEDSITISKRKAFNLNLIYGEEDDEDYLKSQNIIKYKLKYDKDVDVHYKTQTKVFQKQSSRSFTKYDSAILTSQVHYKQQSQPNIP